jgi:transposase
VREIVSAILYVARTGMAWEYLSHDFPPAKTVYDYYAKWESDGTTARIHDLLRSRVREALGRDAEPSAAVLDAQTVKTRCGPLSRCSAATFRVVHLVLAIQVMTCIPDGSRREPTRAGPEGK